MRKNILVVIVIALSFMLYACNGAEKVPAEGETHICAQSGMEIPESQGMKLMIGEKEVWFGNKEMCDMYLAENKMKIDGEMIVPVDVEKTEPEVKPGHTCAQSGVEIPEGEGIKKMKGEEELWFGNMEMLFTYLKDNKMTFMDEDIMLKEEGKNYCEVCSMQIPEGKGLKYMMDEKEVWFASKMMLNKFLEKMKMKVDGDKLIPVE